MANHLTVAGFGQSVDVRRELPQVPAVVQPHLNDTHTDYLAPEGQYATE